MTTKPFNFTDDHMREYDREELQSMLDDGASYVERTYTDTNDIYEQFEGELWAILNEAAEKLDKLTLQVILEADYAQVVNDGDNLRQFIVWFCMEHVARAILQEPEEVEDP